MDFIDVCQQCGVVAILARIGIWTGPHRGAMESLLFPKGFVMKRVQLVSTDAYVYEHWRPDLNQPFWVGKGTRGRARLVVRRNRHHKNIVAKLHELGLSVEVKIVSDNLTDLAAFSLEKKRIRFWKLRGISLANQSIGGRGGMSGCKRTIESCLKQSRTMTGMKKTEEHKRKSSVWIKSDEGREFISRLHTGRKRPPETGQKIRLAKLKHWQDPVIRQHYIDGQKERKHTEQSKEIMRVSAMKPETRKAKSEAAKRQWQNLEFRQLVTNTMRKTNAKRAAAKLIILIVMWLFVGHQVYAQSSPGLAFGQVPTPAQWNSFFAAKQDYLGSPPLLLSGGTMSGKATTVASTTLNAGFNLPQGSAPSTPTNGDMWATSAGVFAQINGSTVGPFGTGIVGTLAVTSGGTGVGTFTANLPIIGNGTSALAQGTVTSTNGATLFATFSGARTNGNCVSIDANGNLVAAGGACTTGGAGGTVSAGVIGQLAIYVVNTTTVGGLTTCNNGYVGTDGAGVNLCRTTLNTTLSATITALGTIATGTWQATTIAAQFGGTGVNNGASTITIGGNVTFSGAFAFLATLSASTSPTFPAGTYTLATQTGTSGGVPYYSSATTQGSSGVLGANLPVFGGGAGSAPIAGTRSGNTTQVVTTTGAQTNGNCVSIDASGNHIAAGVACAVGSTSVLLNTLTASSSTTVSDTTSFTVTYKSYTLVFTNFLPATSADNCQIQVQVASAFPNSGYLTEAISQVSVTNPTAYIPCSFGGQNPQSTETGMNGSITVYQPSANAKAIWGGQFWNFYGAANGSFSITTVIGKYNTAGVVTGFQAFYNTTAGSARSSGIASGTISVYGNP